MQVSSANIAYGNQQSSSAVAQGMHHGVTIAAFVSTFIRQKMVIVCLRDAVHGLTLCPSYPLLADAADAAISSVGYNYSNRQQDRSEQQLCLPTITKPLHKTEESGTG